MEWKDPPPVDISGRSPKRKPKYAAEARELRERPGEWGVILTTGRDEYSSANSLAAHIRKGDYTAFPKDDFDATVRSEEDIVRVYCRYLGG